MAGPIASLWPTPTPPDHVPLSGLHSDVPSSLRHRLRTALVFFTHRMWRGGSRILIQVAVFLLAAPLLLHLAPARFTAGYSLPWSAAAAAPRETGILRVVVFGSQDLAGSSPAKDARKTWTEQLCAELPGCASYLSFVPEANSKPGLTSNSLYAAEVDALQAKMKDVDLTESPAQDYQFLLQQYPVPAETPDLEAQIKAFLVLAPPRRAPRHTIWVFTFGTWDIWNVAALPRETGQGLVDSLVAHLFAQMELLYAKSLNPASIAFSDFWANVSDADIDRLADPSPGRAVDERELESFRAVIPELADVTLAPGWQHRPGPPVPHSRAEQMRNADFLTRRWNAQVKAGLESWTAKGRSRPEGIETDDVVGEASATASLREHLAAAAPRPQHEAAAGEAAADEGAVYAPYPRRAGLQLRRAAEIIDAMTEEELRRGGVHDGTGRGTRPANDSMRFADVWTPCTREQAVLVAGMEPVPDGGGGGGGEACATPDDYLFYDAFTVSQRAMRGLAASAAEHICRELFVS